jgi:hypothetical protein
MNKIRERMTQIKDFILTIKVSLTETVYRLISRGPIPSERQPFVDRTSKEIGPQRRRKLRRDERALLNRLLARADEGSFVPANLETLEVIPLNGGGIGGLRLLPAGATESRRYGGDVALERFVDSDGIPIWVSLFVDEQRCLFEIDIAKADLSAVVRFPQCDG